MRKHELVLVKHAKTANDRKNFQKKAFTKSQESWTHEVELSDATLRRMRCALHHQLKAVIPRGGIT